jgi:hypothetical protein
MTSSDAFALTITGGFQAAAIPIPATIWDTPPDADASPPVTGVAQDITGWQFMFTVKKNLDDDDTIAIYKDDTQTGGVDGKVSWEIPASVTATLEAKVLYYWDVRVIIPSKSGPNQLLAGTIPLNPSVGKRLIPGT